MTWHPQTPLGQHRRPPAGLPHLMRRGTSATEMIDLQASKQAEKKLPPIQRIAWLLDKISHESLTEMLGQWLQRNRHPVTPLASSQPRKGHPHNSRCNLIMSTQIIGVM